MEAAAGSAGEAAGRKVLVRKSDENIRVGGEIRALAGTGSEPNSTKRL